MSVTTRRPVHTLLIHQAFVSPHEAGGTRHFELGRHVVRAGDRFTIVAGTLSYLTGGRTGPADGGDVEEYEGVRVHRAWTYDSLHRSFAWRVVAFLTFMASSFWRALRVPDVDVVMGTTPPIFQAVSAALVAMLRRKPLLLEVRDLWPEFAIGMGVLTNPVGIRVARMVEAWLYRRASRLLVNSPAYVTYLQGRGVPADRIDLVPNGVDPAMFDPSLDGRAFRETHGVAADAYVVTYAGALGPANDIGTLLDAMALLRHEAGLVLLLAGGGKDVVRLQARVGDEGLSSVRFLGALPKTEMAGLLAATDACIAILQDIPEFRTTYPNKVFDYMAAARPTILAIDGVIRDVIEQARGGVFVPPGNATALAAAIEAYVSDPARGREDGARARTHVIAHFDRGEQAGRFIGVLRRVAGLSEQG